MGILVILLIIISIVMLIVSVLMAPDATNISGALVGSSDIDLFIEKKTRGAKRWFVGIMFTGGFALLILSIILKVIL